MLYRKTFLILIVLIFVAYPYQINSNVPQTSTSEGPFNKADAIYYNGTIITMNQKENRQIKYVAIAEGRIIAIQERKSFIQRYIGPQTEMIDLQGKALMPGFIDPHSHFSLTAVRYAQGFDISPPPFGTVTSISQLLSNIKEYINSHNIPPGEVISAGGYSDIDMAQRRHPTRFQLDYVSTVNPIVLTHFSAHIVVANTFALEMVGYTDALALETSGGVIDTYPNGTITGVCRQHAITPFISAFSKRFDNLTVSQIKQTAYHYFSNGVTTVQDILFTDIEPKVYFQLGDQLPIEVNAYVYISVPDLSFVQNIVNSYSTSKFKVKGGKFILDGSIQGFTALLKDPYWVPQSMYSQDLTNYTYDDSRSCRNQSCGQDNFPAPTLLRELYRYLFFNNLDIISHCNGDQAAENMLDAIEWARQHMRHETRSRVTMIHAQTVHEEQLDRMVQLNVHPSFFPVHIYLWGDKHYQIFLGPQRAKRMNPVGSAARRGLKYTLHNDSPVVLMGLFKGYNTFLKGIYAAVNRKTITGRILDDGSQKISIYDALKGVTINAAWQANEDGEKGSIEVGKVADLIILNKNPLELEPEEIDSLKVEATIKKGNLVFGRYPSIGTNKIILN